MIYVDIETISHLECHKEELPCHFPNVAWEGKGGEKPLSFKSPLMFLMYCNSRKQQYQEPEPRETETERKTIFQDHSSSSFFFFVILVSLMFDIKDAEIVFPDVVYSVIINLPCKTTAFGAKSDTKGPSLDLWCWARKDWKRKRGARGKKVRRCHQTKSVNFQTVVVNFERRRERHYLRRLKNETLKVRHNDREGEARL